MRLATFSAEAEVEENHWWFVGRRKLFARLIKKIGIAPDAAILDVGSSTGTNLRMLRSEGFANFQGVDISPESKRFCESKGLGSVRLGSILDLPYPSDSFDLVLATDVIEHVDDDLTALSEIQRILRPGGFALITVPAFQSLWGPQDVVAEHKRRYRMPQLLARIERSELDVVARFHFNYLLFLPIFLARKLLRFFAVTIRSENDLNFGLMNSVLRAVFGFDAWSAALLKPPFGVSILAVCQKPADAAHYRRLATAA
jgi:SAM-dependent methyltransferase